MPWEERPVALVTGGGRRIGAAVSRRLARAGYRILLTWHRSRGDAEGVAREVGGTALRLDLARPASFAPFAARVARLGAGRLDLLVHDAAVFPRTPLAALDGPSFDFPFAVNLRGPVLLTLALRPLLAPSRGRVVFLGDALAHRLFPSHLPYCLSKVALAAAVRALRRDLAPEVAVSLASPGLALPPEGFPPERWEALKRKAGGGHLNSPERVAEAVLRAARRGRKL